MESFKEALAALTRGRLVVQGKGRTYAKLPVWLAVLAALGSLRLAVLTVLLCVAFGLRAQLVKG